MRRFLVAALVAAALPIPAGASAPRHVTPAMRFARQQWAARYRELARNLPVTPLLDAVDAAMASETYDFAEAIPAGDLDGDGTSEIADFRGRETFDDTTGEYSVSARVEMRRGRDGKLLWSKPLTGDYPLVLFTGVGKTGKPGMITVAFQGDEPDAVVAGAGAGVTAITAYEGNGNVAWTYSTQLAYAASIVHGAGTQTYVDDLGDLVPGGGTDMLLDTLVGAGAGDPVGLTSAFRGTVQLRVLDGATGTVRDVGTAYDVESGYVYPSVVADVTGDKRDDIGVVVESLGTPELHLLSSADGKERSSAVAIADGDQYFVRRLTDVTGDGRSDLATLAMSFEDDSYKVTLVDGAKGTAVWTRDGWGSVAVGNVDGRRGDEIVLTTQVMTDDKVGFTAVAYNASGRAVWSVARSLPTPDAEEGYMSRTSLGFVGDVHGDGVLDIGYAIVVTPFGGNARRDEGLVNGRTGRVARDPAPDMVMAGVVFDGRGNDAYTRTFTNGVLDVTAWRGDAPARLWQSSVAVGSKGDRLQGTYGAYLDRDRCGDLLVTVAGARTTTIMLSGATGAPAWALTRSGDGAGVVTHPKARSVRTFARTC
jgi:hypothetical protein